MTKKQIDSVLLMAQSHLTYIPGGLLGVTRFQAFLALKPLLKGKNYWYALKQSYGMTDNLFYYKVDVQRAFECTEPGRSALMDNNEREYLANLPETVTIYRGMTKQEQKSKDYGVSWTLKKERAEFFAFKYMRNFTTNKFPKVVHKMVIPKHKIVAFFNGRLEFEIIYIDKSSDEKVNYIRE